MNARLKINKIFVLICLAAFTTNALAVIELGNGSATGQWYDPNRNGEGFYVEEIGEGEGLQLGVAMYSFDESGNQLWFTGTVAVAPGDIGAVVPVIQVEGPEWGSGFDPADATITEFGNVTVQFTSCTTALFSVESNIPELENFDFTTVRLTAVTGTSCVDKQYSDPEGGTTITPGLWTDDGACFYVNEDGTKIVDSDQCSEGVALAAVVPGLKVNKNGKLGVTPCPASAVCTGTWNICLDCSTASVSCTSQAGTSATIYFVSDNTANTDVWTGEGGSAICYGRFSATPAE